MLSALDCNKNEIMEAIFSFFKAGQGGFYGGKILSHNNYQVYTVVYDCGTSPFIIGNSQSLNEEIDFFKGSSRRGFPETNEIDLLFISHLDYDHVSGLKRLLTEFKVKNIILPYIRKEHRHYFLISFENSNSPIDLSFDDYASFLDSPHAFSRETSDNAEVNLIFIDSNENFEVNYQNYDDTEAPEIYKKGTRSDDIEEFENENFVSTYKNNLQFFIQQKWEFTTFVKGIGEESISKLNDSLKKILGKKPEEKLTLENLKKLTTHSRKKAHKCYRDCLGGVNSHGLVLLHGPIGYDYLAAKLSQNCELSLFKNNDSSSDWRNSFLYKIRKNQTMYGTLLFGDSSINSTKNNPVKFPNSFRAKLLNARIIQIPHHGSKENWNLKAFDDLRIGSEIINDKENFISVCNFGFGNKYGHPCPQILNDLRSNIFLNTQFSRLNIHYFLIFRD